MGFLNGISYFYLLPTGTFNQGKSISFHEKYLNSIELYSLSTLKALTCGRCVELVISLQNSFFSSTYIRISTLSLNSIIGRYYLFYGVSSLAAQVDGLDTPPPPKCTSLVYLYSDMWRSFDVGLYNYIHRERS